MPKTFIDTFIEHRNGGAAIDMQKRLEEVIKGVCETGLAGKLTLTLTVKPASKSRGGDVDAVTFADTIKAAVPSLASKESVFFVSPDMNLTRENPMQMNIGDLKDLDRLPKPEPKELK
jgi:hypothetical protein